MLSVTLSIAFKKANVHGKKEKNIYKMIHPIDIKFECCDFLYFC